ncbi:DUF2189 domain-containing protein [Zavarzinia compransoris]|uniref:DUF2189 domain-containing protein n=1 Tax=Zavarzinia marina TaxID=2911065 RepID=UPI001F3E2D4D|nr:DUF2189 domain-containing protein [Zavarzinia marina]MCF4164774.1 DUF2189 domain-containing protein [Zavarzinia marina]
MVDASETRWLPVPEEFAPMPVARRVTMDDLWASIRAGLADYNKHMAYGLGFGLFYVVFGAAVVATCLAYDWGHLIFPALSGFLLFGPFAALGLYEISRRRQDGESETVKAAILAFRRHGGTQIALFGLFLVIATLAWLKVATLIYALFFGLAPVAFDSLIVNVLTTGEGFRFALTGVIAGAVIAGTIFAASVFAVPMLLDRDVDVVTAVVASLMAVRDNFRVMAVWGLVVAGLTALGIMAGFIGLTIVLPVLGHATWHLYARVLRHAKLA